MKKFFGLILTILIISLSFSSEIDNKIRVPNKEPGWCMWCCLQTLGVKYNIPKLKTIMTDIEEKDKDQILMLDEDRFVYRPKSAAYPDTIKRKLVKLRVKHKIQDFGNHDTELIKYAMQKDLGCVVVMNSEGLISCFKKPGKHAVMVIDFTDEIVEFADPNVVQVNYLASRDWFDKYFEGFIVVVAP